jgi:hypothetical protein
LGYKGGPICVKTTLFIGDFNWRGFKGLKEAMRFRSRFYGCGVNIEPRGIVVFSGDNQVQG